MRKRILRWLTLSWGPYLFRVLLRCICLTCKVRLHGEWKFPTTPCVIALWHGELLMMPFFYQWFYPKHRPLSIIVSQHKDGEILARIAAHAGINCLRGSSSKGAVGVLKEAFKEVGRGGDIAVTPDGPRGPRYSVADGVVALSMRKKIPIITLNCHASKVWRLKSWDRLFIPKPFSTIDFFIGEPFETHMLEVDEAKKLTHERLMRHAF